MSRRNGETQRNTGLAFRSRKIEPQGKRTSFLQELSLTGMCLPDKGFPGPPAWPAWSWVDHQRLGAKTGTF